MFLRYLNFCPDLFGHVGKKIDKKARLISKCATSQTGILMVTIPLLSNISRSKSNQGTKFGQLMINNVRNISFRLLFVFQKNFMR